jgi:hypothetical protein
MASDPHPQAPIDIEHGDAIVPDADDAATAADLAPEDPPADAPAIGDPDKKPSVSPPVPAHGEMASQEQIREAVIAAEEAGGGGTDMGGIPTGEADTGRPGQGGTGQGTDDSTVGSPEVTAEAARAARGEDEASR